jgi:hypothetical protein
VQNFSNIINVKDEVEQQLKVKQMDHASYEDKIQQVRTASLHQCIRTTWQPMHCLGKALSQEVLPG